MLQDALWFWEQMPLLQNVQLPWRLLGPVAICMALLIAQLGRLLLSLPPRWRNLGMAAAMALLIVPNLVAPALQTVGGRGSCFLDAPAAIAARIRDHHHGGGDAALDDRAARIHTCCGYGAFGRRRDPAPGRTPFSWSSPVRAKVASTIEMKTAWFPGWEVRVDGQPVPAGPGTPSGLITFQVPSGEHLVEVRYGRTALEKPLPESASAPCFSPSSCGVFPNEPAFMAVLAN